MNYKQNITIKVNPHHLNHFVCFFIQIRGDYWLYRLKCFHVLKLIFLKYKHVMSRGMFSNCLGTSFMCRSHLVPHSTALRMSVLLPMSTKHDEFVNKQHVRHLQQSKCLVSKWHTLKTQDLYWYIIMEPHISQLSPPSASSHVMFTYSNLSENQVYTNAHVMGCLLKTSTTGSLLLHRAPD